MFRILRNLLHNRSRSAAKTQPPSGPEEDARPSDRPPDTRSSLLQTADRLFAAGDYPGAIHEYDRLLEEHPADIDIIRKKGNAFYSLGRLDEALAAYQSVLDIDPDNYAVNYNYGNVMLRQGKLELALQAYERALATDPECVDSLYMSGNIYMELKNYARAREQYAAALRLQPDNPFFQYGLGNALLQEGKRDDADTHLLRAIDIFENLRKRGEVLAPRENNIFANACCLRGVILGKKNQIDKASAYFAKCRQLAPDDVGCLANIAYTMFDARNFDAAVDYIDKALTIQPEYLRAIIAKIHFLEKLNRIDDAASLLERGLSIAPENTELKAYRLLLFMRNKQFDEAATLISSIDPEDIDSLPHQLKAAFYYDCGQVFDRLDEIDRAFEYFKKANSEKANSSEMTALAGSEQNFARMIDSCLHQSEKGWDTVNDLSGVEDPEISPVFFCGFPRSGTTLIGKILEAHPGIRVLEETDAIGGLIFRELKSMDDYVDFVLNLAAADVVRLRKDYFSHVSQYVSLAKDVILIDKLPLYTVYLPFIHILFPKAKIIFAARHGCDVILSNFMQNYALNPAMANFLDLHSAAVMYDKIMKLYTAYRQALSLNIHEIRYEDVVDNFDTTTRRLLEFVGVEWDPVVTQYHKLDKKSEVITPSYAAVTDKIYSHAKYRWTKYRHYMEDEIAMIEPWLREYHYID